MSRFLADTDVVLTIPLIADGVELASTDVDYRVVTDLGQELIARGAVTGYTTGDTEVVITVPAASNALGLALIGGRVIELFVTTEAGLIRIESFYTLEALEPLVDGKNSFQTYGMALVGAAQMKQVDTFVVATRGEKIAALAAAAIKIDSLHFSDKVFNAEADQSRLIVPGYEYDSLFDSETTYNALSPTFRYALRRAQIVEANAILGGNEVEEIRRSGILSATIGESSQFYRTVKPLQLPVCTAAMNELRRFVSWQTKLGRA